MILRVFRSRVQKGREAELASVTRDRGIVESLAIPGLLSLRPGLRTTDDGRPEFVLASTWTDIEAVMATGRDLNSPVAMPAVAEYLESGHGYHYELVVGGSRAVPVFGTRLRVVRGQVRSNAESTFFALTREITTRLLDTEGLIAVEVGRRMDGDSDEAIMVSLWQDEAGETRAAGGDADQLIARDEIGSLYEGETRIEHFEALAMTHDRDGIPAILLADDERRYLYANAAAADISGWSVARLLTMTVDDLAPPEARASVPQMWSAFLEQGAVNGPFPLLRRDGSSVVVRFSARARTPWPGSHASALVPLDAGAAPDIDSALAAAGLAKAV